MSSDFDKLQGDELFDALTRYLKRPDLTPDNLREIDLNNQWHRLDNREHKKVIRELSEKITGKNRSADNDKGTLNAVYDAIRLGPRAVMLQIRDEIPTITKREIGTSNEEIYCYKDGFYSRGEERIRSRANEIYVARWQQALETISELIKEVNESDEEIFKRYLGLKNKLRELLDKGPKGDRIDEVLKQMRLETFHYSDEFNPKTHIPFKNGLLRLSDWQLISHTPDLIYLWRVEANLLIERLHTITLNDCPKYRDFMLGSFEPYDIPMLLQYGGYAFYPSFPRQMTMWIVGRPRIGKGTNARIWKGLNPTGYGAISFEKLMISENRFVFQGIENKNLLVDPEVKRKYKKGSKPDYGNFNKLFGSDSLDLEKKGKQSYDYVSDAKGLFIANLPLPTTDDEPFISRILLVKARDRQIKKSELIPNLDSVILSEERDEIVTLFVRYLKVLSQRGWHFISELSTDATMEMWELFSNVVQFYLDEMIEPADEGEIACDDMYASFSEWCKTKGIPVLKEQTFKKAVGYTYSKKLRGPKGKRYYVFIGCQFADQVDLQVEHQSDAPETRNIRAFYCRYRGCSTHFPLLGVGENNQNLKRVKEPKLNTFNNDSGKAEIEPSQTNNMVFNLHSEPQIFENYIVNEDFKSHGFPYPRGLKLTLKPNDPEVQEWLKDGKIRKRGDDSA